MFFKLLKYDFKNELFQRFRIITFLTVIIICAFFDYLSKANSFIHSGNNVIDKLGLGDASVYILGGMKEFSLISDKHFLFPVLWMVICLLIAYYTLYYPLRDLLECGQNILTSSKSRSLWWLSKLTWVFLSVFVLFVMIYLEIIILCIVSGTPLDLSLSRSVNVFFNMHGPDLLFPNELIAETFLLPWLVMAACCTVQLTMSLYIRPIYSFTIMIAILLASTYYKSPFLIGNYAMPVRSSRMAVGNIHVRTGIILSVSLIILSAFIGILKFRRYDIIRRENN
ncbi:MAG: hypothetical protein IJS22_08355 [Lachnospiraceae bacterium]|nr:hypothetical protein [Lachnospiraceae bacterium]